MSTLQIRKLQSGAFKHVDSIDGEFFLGRFSFKQEFNKAFLVEAYGAKRRNYVIGDISIIPFGGAEEFFTDWNVLTNRLVALNYSGIDTNGIMPVGSYLSNDPTTYTPAALPLSGTEVALLNNGTNWVKIPISELGGGSTEGANSTGNEILLSNTSGIIYNKLAPISTDLEIDLTGAVIGGKAKIYHNSSSVPKINAIETIFLSGEYLLNETNVINIFYLGNNKVSVNIENATQLYAPSNFEYTAVADTIVLTWDNTNTNYVLERSTTETFVSKTIVYTGNLTTYTDTVGFGKIYYYRIKSVKDNFIDSVFVQLYATNLYTNLLTFVAGPKLLLKEPSPNVYSTSSGVNYVGYANSDYKMPADTYSWVEIETLITTNEGSIVALATSNISGNYTLSKFAFLTGNTNTDISIFQNGAYVRDVSGYSTGVNAKLRIVRESNGSCKIYKTSDLITYTLIYTFSQTYTGEMWIIINPRTSYNLITRPFGLNLMLK